MRCYRLIAIAVFVALLSVAAHHSAPALAISYPTGWNLVSGPTGSTLSGATGSIYSLQPGDSNYRTLAANASLTTGWGYWAFFPTGGSLQSAPGTTTYSVTLTAGAYAMLGNPSAGSPTMVTGADSVLTYTPGGDYTDGPTIPAGQGAWVTGSGTVTVTVASAVSSPARPAQPPLVAPPPVASPAPQAAAALPTTATGLKAAALNQSDLPGYSLYKDDTITLPGAIASYHASWAPTQSSNPVLLVQNDLEATGSAVFASSLVQGFPTTVSSDPYNSNTRKLAQIAVGDEEAAVSYTYTAPSGRSYDDYDVFFRRGSIFVLIDVSSSPGTGSLATVTGYAQTIDHRLAGGAPATTPAPSVAAPVAAAPAAHLFQASGSGDGDTPNFTLPTSGANVCVQLTGQSPSGTFGPDASLFFYQASGSIDGIIGDYTQSGCKISHPDDGSGRYYIEVVATSWTNWTITVDAE